MSRSFQLLFFSIVVLIMSVRVNAEWISETYNGHPWYQTRDGSDLDNDALSGAVILTFSDGSYIQPDHRQWDNACAMNCLSTILKKMQFSLPEESLWLPADVDITPSFPDRMVDLRYPGSEEHLIYLFTRRQRMRPRFRYYSAEDSLFISPDGVLNNAYPDTWLHNYSSRDWGIGWANFINYVLCKDLGYGAFDAYQWGPKKDNSSDLVAFRRIVKGFIDNDLPLLLLVMDEAHFNVIIGYQGNVEDTAEPFYIYTTETEPDHWRKIDASAANIWEAEMMSRICFWNHHLNGGCEPGGWADEVDVLNSNTLLCGYTINPDDPLVLPESINNVSSINLDKGEGHFSTTEDGLYAVFHSNRHGTIGGADLFEAKRDNINSEWENIEVITELNSTYSEFEASVRGDGLEICFASPRPGGLGGNDIWRSVRGTRESSWSNPEPISEINSRWQDAGPCLSADGLKIYFHSYRSGSGNIFVAERSSVFDSFGSPNALTSINEPAYGEFVPCISPDEKILYFASNRPGGKGDMDIWKASRSDINAEWSELVNVEPINTIEREYSPWYEAITGLVYFEADRTIGYGSLDIYSYDENW